MAEPDNMVLVLLREMREDIAGVEFQLGQRLDRMKKRLDAMHLNGTKALKGFIGHRSIEERAMGSIDDRVARLDTRIEALEAARA